MKKFSPVLVAVITATLLELVVFSKQNEPPVKYCSDNETCSNTVENSYCDFEEKLQCGVGVCNCLPTHVPIGNDMDPTQPEITCSPRPILIGASCSYDVECTATFGDLSACLMSPFVGTCQCTKDSVYCPQKNECQPRQHFGDNCVCDEQCSHLTEARCMNYEYPRRCRCPSFTMQSPDGLSCIPTARIIGDSCTVHPDQCSRLPHSFCDPKSETCICDNSVSIPDRRNEFCLPLRKHLNMDCREDSQCLPVNSTCEYENRKYFCGCSRFDRFVASLETPDTCLADAYAVGYPCVENIQCLRYISKYSECSRSNNTCQCKQGYYEYRTTNEEFGDCWPTKRLRERCIIGAQCVDASGSYKFTSCINDVCTCQGSELDGICYPSKRLGDSCELDVECKASITGPVICDNNICTSDDNYVQWQGNCIKKVQ